IIPAIPKYVNDLFSFFCKKRVWLHFQGTKRVIKKKSGDAFVNFKKYRLQRTTRFTIIGQTVHVRISFSYSII
ncbi:hypothetical protein, partial [Peribacillus sp. NPDC060253]|uniref:hypothetical protein n=1 Tax=Peribacillus sp. NPDC060253 TaxID=3347084 RepID=UPI00366552F7